MREIKFIESEHGRIIELLQAFAKTKRHKLSVYVEKPNKEHFAKCVVLRYKNGRGHIKIVLRDNRSGKDLLEDLLHESCHAWAYLTNKTDTHLGDLIHMFHITRKADIKITKKQIVKIILRDIKNDLLVREGSL